MKAALSFLFVALSFISFGQPLAGSNLSAGYNPDGGGLFNAKVVRGPDSIFAYFEVDTALYRLEWEKRESYGQRQGTAIDGKVSGNAAGGKLGFRIPEKPWLLVARLINKKTQEIRLDFRQIEANYPTDGLLWRNGKPVLQSYITVNTEVTITNNFASQLRVYHYNEKFPAGSPPFAEKEKPVDPIMTVDSTFNLTSGQKVKFTKPGLYLVQSDTNAPRGISFRVEPTSYPKMTKIEDLSTSLVFISTKDEAERLKAAGADKTAFDKIVLDITRDKDRARTLIKNYFRRIELANVYFSSYKEGWKTDRGMMYLVFGMPDEVNRNGQYEVWTYKQMNAKFTFYKAGSVYDPDYFVLERNKRFAETWYYTVDMWRKSQINSSTRN